MSAARPAPPVLTVLGPVMIRLGGRVVPPGPPRRRALLALLAVRLGQVVPTGQLALELWGDDQPGRPLSTLQTHVSHLRRVLRDGGAPPADGAEGDDPGPFIRHRGRGYVLDAGVDVVDAARFEELTARARARHREQDWLGCRRLLDDALGLWHGHPYQDLPDYPLLREEAERLEQQRVSAVVMRAEARRLLGETDVLAAELREELHRHPTHEGVAAALMTALYASGWPAESLRIYDRVRRHLADELGVDPGIELRELHEQVLRQTVPTPQPPPVDAVPTCSSDPAQGPDAVDVTDDGEDGDDGEKDDGHADGVAGSPAGAVDRGAPPVAGVTLVGRDHDLTAVMSVLEAARRGSAHLLVIVGAAGVGKSELVIEALRRTATADRSVHWVHLPVPAAGAVDRWWTRLCEGPGGPADVPVPVEAAAGSTPPAGRPVVVLDDLERADPDTLRCLELLVERMYAQGPTVVAMTRRLPDVGGSAGEVVKRLLAASRSRRLFLGGLDRAAVAALVREIDDDIDEATIDDVLRLTQGNPHRVLALAPAMRALSAGPCREPWDAWVLGAVTDVVASRLDELGREVRAVLYATAIVPTPPDATFLAEVVAGGDARAGAVAVDRALRSGLLDLAGGRSSGHVLRPSWLTDVLLASDHDELIDVRGAVARTMAERDRATGTDERAEELWRGRDQLLSPDTISVFLLAAERAEHALDFARAELWLRRCLVATAGRAAGLTAPSSVIAEVQTRLWRMLVATRGLADPEARAAARSGLGRADGPGAGLAQTSLLWVDGAAAFMLRRHDDCLVAARALLERSRAATDRIALVCGAYLRGATWATQGHTAEALAELSDAVRAADALGRHAREGMAIWLLHDPRVMARCYQAIVLHELERPQDADEVLDQAVALMVDDMLPSDRCFVAYVEAIGALAAGRADSASVVLRRALDVTVLHGMTHWASLLHLMHGYAEVVGLDRRAGLAEMQEAVVEMRAYGRLGRFGLHLGLLAEAQRRSGRANEARATTMTVRLEAERHLEREPRLLELLAAGSTMTSSA